MIEDIVIEPMTESLLLWRCLHHGPLSRDTIDHLPPSDEVPWERCRTRNLPLLAKLTQTYGVCAIVARDGQRIVGHLRFYPKAVCGMAGAGCLCLQQDFPAGPRDDFAETRFPPLSQIEDKTLVVHCLMTARPQQNTGSYQRKGLGTRMVKALIEWAHTNGWRHIEAESFEDLPIIYEVTGSAGHTFWEKLGFRLADRRPHPELQAQSDFVSQLEEQARSLGVPPERARDRLIMRLDLLMSFDEQDRQSNRVAPPPSGVIPAGG
ncbi:MAG: GNAT family N-acetyltransferase [Phycisphaerae bacterium]|nr:GNAT family N-acetyltransferase [Phycisphaerae bacterium]